MEPFLLDVARQVARELNQGHEAVEVILPSRRAGVFFRKYLASCIEKPVWEPQILSIEDFVFRSTGLQKADPVASLFALYHIHLSLAKEEARQPDDFFPVGEMVLADFDEVDHHMVDAESLFEFLHEARAIDLWNPDGTPLTSLQQRYLTFFASLTQYYSQLRENSLARGEAWQGLATRLLATRPVEDWLGVGKSKLFFAGFNALTPAEETLLNKAYAHLGAVVIWDVDSWYIDDPLQEAGLFLRRYRSTGLPAPVKNIGNWLAGEHRNVCIIGAPLHVAQAREVGNILTSAPFTREPGWQSRTAVIPADESLLLPLLNSIPGSVGPYNVTMGIPLRQTPGGSLAVLWLDMLANARLTGESAGWCFFLSDFVRVAMHPLMAIAFQQLVPQVNALVQTGRLFVGADEVDGLLSGSLIPLNFNPHDPVQSVGFLSKMIAQVAEAIRDCAADPFARASADSLVAVIQKVSTLAAILPPNATLITIRRLMNHLASSVKIPFGGEPLTGIQVMGMLETRALDFDNIILLGMNDDVIPGSGLTPSFIPSDIRTETFGMAGFREKTAVTAYHFYRLLQRTKNVFLVYNNVPGHLGKGDPSRFLLQIKYEFAKNLPHTVVTEEVRSEVPEVASAKPVEIEKNDEVMAQLKMAAQKGFSPTSLSHLVECPLRFYLMVVKGIRPPKEYQISIESDLFGDAVHHVAEKVFGKLIGIHVQPHMLKPDKERVTSMLSGWFDEHRPDLDRGTGNNLLVFQVAIDYLVNFFLTEQRMAATQRIVPVEVEAKLRRTLQIPTTDGVVDVVFEGRADRIDLRDDVPVVIDYKTGTVDAAAFNVADMQELVSNPKQAKALQLMTYAWLSAGSAWFNPPFRCAVWPLRAPSKALIPLSFNSGTGHNDDSLIGKMQLDLFEEQLQALLVTLFDRGQPFQQTSDADNCRYCPFVEMCNRVKPGR